jgi:hypothetical protein
MSMIDGEHPYDAAHPLKGEDVIGHDGDRWNVPNRLALVREIRAMSEEEAAARLEALLVAAFEYGCAVNY